MISAIENPISEEQSSSKRQKKSWSKYDEPLHDESHLTEELREFDEEWKKSGGFDVDLSKLSYTFGAGTVDLEDDDLADELQTNRDLIDGLCKMAISLYKDDTGISLGYVDVLRANYHPSAAITFYITFRADDPSDGVQAKQFRAVVRYFPGHSKARSCIPRPSTC